MKVILQNDVRDLGKVGDLVNVSTGFARNFLFPQKLAAPATEKREKELIHFKKVAESKKAKVLADKKDFVAKINGLTISFTRNAGDEDKIFGSVTTTDIAKSLSEQGFDVDKRDIHLEEAIKQLGQFKAIYKVGEGISAEIKVNVERQA